MLKGCRQMIKYEELKFFTRLFLPKLRTKITGNYMTVYIFKKYLDIFLINPYYEDVITFKVLTI
jgi:hypothetical protein